MRVIGVVDLHGGLAVHARGGARERYQPVQMANACEAGNALALARWYAEQCGLTELYVADLDAIAGQPPQDGLVGTLATAQTVWLDSGLSNVAAARQARALGVRHAIVGLETLGSYGELRAICAALPDTVAFSLDLRQGNPVRSPGTGIPAEAPEVIAARAADAGAPAIIVLDLARVGMAAGIDVNLIARIRDTVPDVTLLAGGGVGGREDLTRLADVGCDAVLVATALQDGRLGADDLAAIAHRSVVRQTAD